MYRAILNSRNHLIVYWPQEAAILNSRNHLIVYWPQEAAALPYYYTVNPVLGDTSTQRPLIFSGRKVLSLSQINCEEPGLTDYQSQRDQTPLIHL